MEKTDNWAAFGSEYLKALDVLSNTDEYVIVNVSSKEETRNNVTKDVLHLHLERNGTEKLFGCNKTNAYAVQEECTVKPSDAIGRVITFNKVDVIKPNTTPPEMVKGLRVVFKPIEVTESDKVDTEEAGINSDSTM